jgi:ribosomal protein S11
MAKLGKKSRKTRKIVPNVQAHITASFNNTIVTITDEK